MKVGENVENPWRMKEANPIVAVQIFSTIWKNFEVKFEDVDGNLVA